MIKSVVVSLNWTPDVVGKMYVDGIDFQGLEYWYDHIRVEVERLQGDE